MNKFDYKKISEELEFDITDIPLLIESMQSLLVEELKTTEQIIDYWINSCFRADDFEEILEQFEPNTEINEIWRRIFILPSKKLIVIGF